MTRTILALLSALLLTAGYSSANAQCPGGRCSSAGFYSPWIGAWYYASPCASGPRAAAGNALPASNEAVAKPAEHDTAADATAEPGAENCQPVPEPEEPVIETVEFKPFCQRVAELINAQRAALGLPALELDTSLCVGCDRHSSWMASGGGFRHAYYSGGRECIAYGVRSPEAVVSLWLNSSGHRAIILGGGRILGVGCSGNYWTLRVR